MVLIAIIFPGLSFLLRGKILSAIIATILQVIAIFTFLIFGIGFLLWLILVVWAIMSNNNEVVEKRHKQLIEGIQIANSQTPLDLRSSDEKDAESFGYKLAQDYHNSKSFYHGFFIVLLIIILLCYKYK